MVRVEGQREADLDDVDADELRVAGLAGICREANDPIVAAAPVEREDGAPEGAGMWFGHLVGLPRGDGVGWGSGHDTTGTRA